VTINPSNGFFDTNGMIKVEINARRDYVTLANFEFAAFGILHELGHKTGKLLDDGGDPLGAISVINNGQIAAACYGEVPSQAGP
jgi:hypothetical protein